MRNPFTGLYSGPGRGLRDGVRQQLRGNALWSGGPEGAVVAFLMDSGTGCQRRWQGEIDASGRVLLWAETPGPWPDTAYGAARFEPNGALLVDLAAAGLGMAPEQWHFTLGPEHSYGVAGW
jgi:hypothetical protein